MDDVHTCVLIGAADAPLAEAIGPNTTRSLRAAAMIVAPVRTGQDLEKAAARAQVAALPIWCVYENGNHTALGARRCADICGRLDSWTTPARSRRP